jgi:7,8-dihydroneopterin aldolase/epimerase/oxygenase
MFTVHLNKLIFFAHHGVHDEESIIGTDFEVSVSIDFDAPEKVVALKDTINYVSVFEVIKKRFATPGRLLETLAQHIVDDIYAIDNRITTINISIDKINPPISNFIGSVGVTYSKSLGS